MKTQSISSGSTMFLKLVLPVMWTTFFGTLVGYILLSEDGAYTIAGGALTPGIVKLAATIFLLVGILFFYFFFLRIKRVDVDTEHIYVTNYFTSRRYPFSSIEKITERRMLFSRPVDIHFKEKGYFGKKITFLSSKEFREFAVDYPAVGALIVT